MYRDRFSTPAPHLAQPRGQLVRAFRRLQDAGYLEVITSTATHPSSR
jgi:predicted glycosyl hydrolase (DUF1957 family)